MGSAAFSERSSEAPTGEAQPVRLFCSKKNPSALIGCSAEETTGKEESIKDLRKMVPAFSCAFGEIIYPEYLPVPRYSH